MIVCPGCGGQNEPDSDTCSFCMRRLGESTGGAPNMASAMRSATVRWMLLVVLVVLLLLVILLIRATVLSGAG